MRGALARVLRSARTSQTPTSMQDLAARETQATKSRSLRNNLIGFTLLSFVGAVYAYSMVAVKQEDFSDVEAAHKAGIPEGNV
eukprot:m.218074 g.218074  ORF g.218074 m.218074 type:complete len:83 (+) comp33251_c1_seq1:136-384(+)